MVFSLNEFVHFYLFCAAMTPTLPAFVPLILNLCILFSQLDLQLLTNRNHVFPRSDVTLNLEYGAGCKEDNKKKKMFYLTG